MKKTFIFLFFLLCSSAAIVAQTLREFSVEAFEEKHFDTAARDERYKIVDGNGDLFSIIKLVAATPGDDLRAYVFDFGLPESRVKSVDGDVWVYVQRNAMRVTIKRDGFKTVKYDLPVTVQPGQVFEMTLRATPIVVKKRHLLFQVTPADSKAYIQYKAEGETEFRTFGDGQVSEDGMLSDKLVLGSYLYRITSKNYHLSEGFIELTDEDGTFTESVTLRPNYGTVMLTTAQGGAIFIDGDSIGTGTCTANLAPGYYNVECRKKGHRSVVESIEVKVGDTIDVALNSPVPITGALDVVSSPLKATITIDGIERGKTPAEIKELLIGSHSVELSRDGYIPQTLTIDVKENETTELNVALEKVVAGTTKHPSSSSTTAKNGSINGHEYVDLGLSVKWATCNVGATKPEEYGGYYAWGETEEKEDYSWETYKWCNGRETTITKYGTKRVFGTVDNKTVLDPEDDVARAKWGGSWRMPTKAEYDELRNNCTRTWTTKNGINGYMITSKINGNSIFLPAAGVRNGPFIDLSGSGYYWSSSLDNQFSSNASYLYFSRRRYGRDTFYRSYGRSVRPVSK